MQTPTNSEQDSGKRTPGKPESPGVSTTSETELKQSETDQAIDDITSLANSAGRRFYMAAQKAKTRMDRRNNLIRGDTMFQFAEFLRGLKDETEEEPTT